MSGGELVSTWELPINGMRRTSVGLLNHPAKHVNGNTKVVKFCAGEPAAEFAMAA